MQKRRKSIWDIAMGLLLTALPAYGAEPSMQARALLQQEIAGKVPQNWQVHVSRRGDDLIAFLMPPYQEAFNLWYEPEQLREKMLSLCPASQDAIWPLLSPEQKVKIEPTVGGKSAEAMRLTCDRKLPPA